MSKSRIYIAGPMTGRPGFNYTAFEDAARDLCAAGLYAVSPADPRQRDPEDPDRLAPGLTYEDCLARGIQKLLGCSGVATLPGWEDSRGARLEVALARLHGLRVAPLAHWLKEDSAGGGSIVAVDPMRDLGLTEPMTMVLGRPGRSRIDPLRFAPAADEGPTVMVNALGTASDMRRSLMRLGRKVKAQQTSTEGTR